MVQSQVKVEVYVLVHKETAKYIILYLSSCAGGNQAAELWCGKETGRGFIFHQDAYYDEKLRLRRRGGKMISPTEPMERLIYVGEVWGTLPIQEKDYFLISKSEIALPIVGIV